MKLNRVDVGLIKIRRLYKPQYVICSFCVYCVASRRRTSVLKPCNSWLQHLKHLPMHWLGRSVDSVCVSASSKAWCSTVTCSPTCPKSTCSFSPSRQRSPSCCITAGRLSPWLLALSSEYPATVSYARRFVKAKSSLKQFSVSQYFTEFIVEFLSNYETSSISITTKQQFEQTLFLTIPNRIQTLFPKIYTSGYSESIKYQSDEPT